MRSVRFCILIVMCLFAGSSFPAKAEATNGRVVSSFEQVDPNKLGGPRKQAKQATPAAAKKSANAGGGAASTGGAMKSTGKKHHRKHRRHAKKL